MIFIANFLNGGFAKTQFDIKPFQNRKDFGISNNIGHFHPSRIHNFVFFQKYKKVKTYLRPYFTNLKLYNYASYQKCNPSHYPRHNRWIEH